jgi:PKD domain
MSGRLRTVLGAAGTAAAALPPLVALLPGSASALQASPWVPARTISTPGGDALTARVALDSDGNAIVAWARAMGGKWVIQAAYRPFGGAWQQPRDLSRPSLQARAPQVTFDAEGNAVAVWERFDGMRLVVQTASFSASTERWSIPQTLSGPGGDSLSPEVAVDGDGNALAVWARSGAGRWAVQSAYRPRRGLWGQAQTIVSAVEVVSPQVIFDVRGGAVAAWAALIGTSWSIETADRPPGGPWSAPEVLAASGEYPRVRLLLGVDGRGNVFALWEGLNGVRPAVEAAVRPASQGRWSPARQLSDDTGDAVSPQLAVDSRGDAVAVWARSDGNSWVVQSAQRRAEKSWDPPATLSSSSRDAVAPAVALDPRGNALAVWTRSNGANSFVRSSYCPSRTGVWSPARSISAPGGDAVAPAVAMDGRGNGTIVWSRFDGTGFTTQASGYDASGPELRDLAVPDAGVVGEPLSFSVMPLDAWSRVAGTRWTFGDGGTASGARAGHVYTAAGRYTVRVSSTDAIGLRSAATHRVSIAE